MFLQHDFKFVSNVRGGIKGCVKELKRAGGVGGVGLAEGAESVLEGTLVGMNAGEREVKKIEDSMRNLLKRDDTTSGDSERTSDVSTVGELPSEEGGWNRFVKKLVPRRHSEGVGGEESGGTSTKGGIRELFKPASRKSSRETSGSRGDELAKIKQELTIEEGASPERSTPRWVRRLSEKAAEASTELVMASQKIGEEIGRVGKGLVSPKNGDGEGEAEANEGYYVGKVVDVAEWIQHESFVDGKVREVQTFSATRYSTHKSCQLLVSETQFLAVELFEGGFGGEVVEQKEVARLNKITTNNVLSGLVVFHFNKKESTLSLHEKGGGNEGAGAAAGEEEVDLLQYVVEDFKDCISLMTNNFKALRRLEKKRKGGKKKKEEEEGGEKEVECSS